MAARDQRPTQDTPPFLGASGPSLGTLTSGKPEPDDDAPERPAWTPTDRERSKRECQKCGAHLSARWRRVWGDNEGVVHYCRKCVPRSVRFGEDIYGRKPEDFDPDDFDVTAHNA